ncbi:MAG: radical SAM protein [Verrucomicrobia bacterium]|nr:radical SAM protein [Verrucomicrobiota bacterium]
MNTPATPIGPPLRPHRDCSVYMEAVRSRALEVPYNPPVIYLEAVRGCPHACAMCHFGRTQVQRMAPSLLARLEPGFPDLEVLAIHGQGEPLVGDLEYFVGQSVKHGFVLHLNTTGFLLTRRLADLLAQTRLSIRFSVHAGTPATYRRLMGQDLDKVKDNVAYLVRQARRSGLASDFWFSFLVLKENVDEIEDFLLMAHDCGIQSVRFMRPLPNWKTLRGASFPDRDFRFSYFEQFNLRIHDSFMAALPRYQALCDKLGLTIESGSMVESRSHHRPLLETANNVAMRLFGNKLFPLARIPGSCLAPWIGQLVINVEGNVRLCCSTNYSLGNLHDASLSALWNSPRMKAIRASFARGCNPKACGYCEGITFDDYPNNAFVGRDRDT